MVQGEKTLPENTVCENDFFVPSRNSSLSFIEETLCLKACMIEWGCFRAYGTHILHTWEGIINSEKYIQVLEYGYSTKKLVGPDF